MSRPVVLVTGASRGIGLAVTRILLSNFSADVVAFQRTVSPELKKLKESNDRALTIFEGDVTSATATENAVETALSTYGSLSALVLNAGTLHPLGRIDTPNLVDEWKSLFDVNFFSLVQTIQMALPHLRKIGGRVVFVSSGAATGGSAGWGAYSASKAAMNSLCRTLAAEEPDIVAVALRPGAVDTEMQSTIRAIGAAHMSPKDLAKFTGLYETGTLVKPEDSGHVIAALAVNAGKDLTGKFVSWDEEAMAPFRR
ncbi:hypothetical protein FRB96_000113 [Tulasnella sp. 330]|nr:hypothetical protein FRB96_000113 [Tulasnella sp. 330]KAG8882930.1 hypothetical protein FRB97_007526 [Tulasnella sp. 331]KAG8891014.1 hypothetical protein FRB98_000023 [Tulasnella sp. 332]